MQQKIYLINKCARKCVVVYKLCKALRIIYVLQPLIILVQIIINLGTTKNKLINSVGRARKLYQIFVIFVSKSFYVYGSQQINCKDLEEAIKRNTFKKEGF